MSLLNEDIEIMRRVPLLAGMKPDKLKLLAYLSELVIYQEGDVVFRQGEPGESAYLIYEGTASVVKDSADGPVQINELGRFELFGELAIVGDTNRTATVVAASELKVLCLSKEVFLRLIHQSPEAGIKIMKILVNRLLRAEHKLYG